MPAATGLRTVTGRTAPRLLRLSGEIDLYTAAAIREQVLAVPATDDVVIDMSDVRFFGAAAVTVLLELRTRLHHVGRTLQLAAVPRVVHRPLELLALLDELPCLSLIAAEANAAHARPVVESAEVADLNAAPLAPRGGG